MLGRHVYRVSPSQAGGWRVQKEGEANERASRATREDAVGYATQLAAKDKPSKIIVEEAGGAIVEERLFGADEILELERAAEGDRAPSPDDEAAGDH